MTPRRLVLDPEIVPWDGAPMPPRWWQEDGLPRVLDLVCQYLRALVVAIMGSGKSILLTEVAWVIEQHLEEVEVVVITTPSRSLVRQLGATVARRCGSEKVGQYYADRKQADRRIIVCCNASAPALAAKLKQDGRSVGLWIADEAHQTEAATLHEAADALSPRMAVGFTATPFRSDGNERLRLWDQVAYRYLWPEAFRDQVLVKWRIVLWDGSGADDNVDRVCLDLIRSHGRGPGIVSALSIEDAEGYAAYLRGHGVRAAAIHSRQSKSRQDQLLEDLRDGRLDALVHVSLLAEGVDLPWLQWLCLRRPVGARVRFLQEVGRVLRAHPGKTEGVIIDPHDLFAAHGIQHEEALGEPPPRESGPSQERESEGGKPPSMPPAVAVEVVGRWCRHVLLLLQQEGLAEASKISGRVWRASEPSDKQLAAVRKLAWTAKFVPEPHRSVLKALASPELAGKLTRGAASDLLGTLFGLSRGYFAAKEQGQRFTWPADLQIDGLAPMVLEALRQPPLRGAA